MEANLISFFIVKGKKKLWLKSLKTLNSFWFRHENIIYELFDSASQVYFSQKS
jgi:hypothetical protein